MSEELSAILTFGILSAFLLILGYRKGFFDFPIKQWVVPIRFIQLIGAFAIYFLVSFLGTSLVVSFFKKQIISNYMGYSSWFNFTMSFFVFLFLAIYLMKMPEKLRLGILRRSSERGTPLASDVWYAFYAWALAFPFVLFLSQVIEKMVNAIFHVEHVPDQIAVQFLKSTFSDPLYFILATLSIVVLAPLIEETLFRGFLQTYIRQHLGSKQAIFITSVCFSLFHYSTGQGLGNISIIISLFFLALFLGFLYEKKGSLLSPIVLHASFNTVSVINLYLFGGFTTGL